MKTAALFTSLTAALAATATADVFTFDDLGLADGTEVTTQYPGVEFSAIGGGATRLVTATTPIFPTQPQGLYNDTLGDLGTGFTEPIVADFSSAQTSVGAYIDFGVVGTGIKITAYDGPGGTGTPLGSDSTGLEEFISVDAPGIRSVVFAQVGATTATYLIDNFTFVPAPGAAALFGLGGLALARRRR